MIDHWEDDGIGLEEAIGIVKERKDIAGRPYRYGTHWFPHDIKNRDLWKAISRQEMAMKALKGHGVVQRVARRSIEDGHEAVRRILPSCAFDVTRCESGIDMLSLYRTKQDPKFDIATTPLKDIAKHSADGFKSYALGVADRGGKEQPFDQRPDDVMDTDAPIEEIMRRFGTPNDYLPGRLGGAYSG